MPRLYFEVRLKIISKIFKLSPLLVLIQIFVNTKIDKIGVCRMVGAVPKPLPTRLNAEIILINIQHHRIFNPLRQDRNTVCNARINVGIADMLGYEII
jgi:hypothetical protein